MLSILTSNDLADTIHIRNARKGRCVMMWTDKAFGIYMGDVMAHEPDASHDRDVMFAAALRDRSFEDAAACEAAIEARRTGSFAGSPAVAHRTQVARATRG